MKICTRCFYTDLHPLNITFDDEGVCSGCRVHEEKDTLNWDDRLLLLKKITSNYKNHSGNNYDCIVPVSGARDSYFIVHTVKNILGLNPLLVTYNKHYNTDIGIRNLAQLRISFDCDLIQKTVNPETVKKITRATMRKRGSIYWHCIAGQTVFPVQIAAGLKIPLIIWGAHQGIDQVGMFSHLDEVEMTRKYRKEHDLMGLEAEDLIDDFDHIKFDDIASFSYPDDKEIERVGIRGIYLNNYIRWDSKQQHEEMIKQYNYKTDLQTRTFDHYNDIDCYNYSDVHDYIKTIKFGYGKVTDHVCREIRLKRMTREEGLDSINKYMEVKPQNLNLFLNWLGITERAFHFVIDQFRNPKIWKRDENWKWNRFLPFFPQNQENHFIERARLPKMEECVFKLNPGKNVLENKHYIIIGKGFRSE